MFGLALMIAGWVVLVLVPACRICIKAGYPSWVGVFGPVPAANVVLLWVFAFAKWPIEGQLETARTTPVRGS